MFQRALEHQESHPTYAGSLWIQSQHLELQPSDSSSTWDGQIDPSQIDPIWDGHDNRPKDDPEINVDTEMNVNSDSDKILPNSDTNKSPKHDPVWISNSTLWQNLHNELRNIQAFDAHKTDTGVETSLKSPSEIKDTNLGEGEGQMKKVPSGFWDIDLSDLGIDLSSPSLPTSTV